MSTHFNTDSFFPPSEYALPHDRSSPYLKRPRPDLEIAELSAQVLGTKKRRLEEPLVNQTAVSVNIQELIHHIEKCLSLRDAPLSLVQQAQIAVQRILESSSWSEERKYAELGVLCYYIASGRSLPPGDVGEALLHEIKEQHAYRAKRKMSPLHQPTYALCQFTKMIFTPNGGFNLGGCYAIQSFLEGGLRDIFLSGLKNQIVSVVGHLIREASLQELFQEAFEVCPVFHDLIQHDMALRDDDQVTFVDVRWDVLTVLFLGKLDMVEADRCQYVKLLLDVLKTGTVPYGELRLPMDPFLNICLKNTSEHNHLEQLGLEILQFQKLNGAVLDSGKTRLCKAIKQGILSEFTKNLCTSMEYAFLSDYLDLVTRKLFLIEDCYVKPTIRNFQVVFDGHTSSFPFEGNWEDYSVFSHLRRLFVFLDQKLIPLDTLSALGQCFADHVGEYTQDTELQRGLKTYFISEQFKLDAAQSISAYNQGRSTFTGPWYCHNDALLLLPSDLGN